jgi:drug/metabolite transporter (DMT)-like permease
LNQSSTIKYSLMLLLVTICWGSGFIVVSIGLDCGLSPSLLTTLRMAFACAIMFPIFHKTILKSTKSELKHGVIAGFLLFMGFLLQTMGMQYTIISNSAFLTTTNVIMVPFISWLILRKRPKTRIFFSIALGFIGVSILTRAYDTNINFNLGDILCLLSAVCFALQIAYTEFAVKKVNADSFTFIQLASTAVFSCIYLLIFDNGSLSRITNIPGGLLASVYLGATCTFFAFWAQSVSQKHMSSSKAALILSMEAVFASIFSVLLGYENLELTLIAGGGIIMASIILLEINNKIAAKRKVQIKESI